MVDNLILRSHGQTTKWRTAKYKANNTRKMKVPNITVQKKGKTKDLIEIRERYIQRTKSPDIDYGDERVLATMATINAKEMAHQRAKKRHKEL